MLGLGTGLGVEDRAVGLGLGSQRNDSSVGVTEVNFPTGDRPRHSARRVRVAMLGMRDNQTGDAALTLLQPDHLVPQAEPEGIPGSGIIGQYLALAGLDIQRVDATGFCLAGERIAGLGVQQEFTVGAGRSGRPARGADEGSKWLG